MTSTPVLLLLFCLMGTVHEIAAQQGALKISAEVPVQFAIGYEGKINGRFSVSLSAGVLTQPNSTLIVNVLEQLGTDEEIVLMIDHAFDFGLVGEAGINYNFNRNYVGAFFQVIDLRAGDTPASLVESYFGTSISSYPAKRGRTQSAETFLSLTSTLYQTGILYGRRFPLKNKRMEIDAEFGVSANVTSKSELTSETRNLTALSEVVNDELAGYYSEYAFIPTLTVSFVYKLHSPK
jgi:hypothetical protein